MSDTHPVVEIFGPTIQGEGPDAGRPAHFVRFGGCDYRCSWCDSMYAVDPAQVREAERLPASTIWERIERLPGAPDWVILSGGNPALHELEPLVLQLQANGYKVGVETQGSVWRPWLGGVDRLVISPKPPSSGMATPAHDHQLQQFMASVNNISSRLLTEHVAIKVVVDTAADLEWAAQVFSAYGRFDAYLSVCTPQGISPQDFPSLLETVAQRYAWLAGAVAHDPRLARVTVLPQLHVIAWGAQRGV